MRKLTMPVAVATALLVLALAVPTAGAATAEVDPAGPMTAPSIGRIVVGPGTECAITLTGTLAAAVEVAPGAQFGSVTEVEIENCVGGTVTGVLGLPWRLTVGEILPFGQGPINPSMVTGLLFNIATAAFNVNVSGLVNCLYAGTAGALLATTQTGTTTYTTGSLDALETIRVPFVRGIFACPRTASIEGSFALSTQTIVF
jgi:hypothetical protein